MEKIVSIVVPTYNMENYLRKDLESLIISEGLENVEVIVVNDFFWQSEAENALTLSILAF